MPAQLRRQTDDEIYRFDQRWHGADPWHLPNGIPVRALVPGAVVFLTSLLLLSAFGVSGLWLVAVAAGITWGVAALLTVFTGTDLPLTALLTMIAHEVSAPRHDEPQPADARLRPADVRVLRAGPRRTKGARS